jgi:hypothetical protein
MKPQAPAEGIMLDRHWGDARAYTIACECGDRNHFPNMWIEVTRENDVEHVIVTFYVETKSPWWSTSRWRQIWQMLIHGYVKQESSLILSKQSALNLAESINSSVAEIQQIKVLDQQ